MATRASSRRRARPAALGESTSHVPRIDEESFSNLSNSSTGVPPLQSQHQVPPTISPPHASSLPPSSATGAAARDRPAKRLRGGAREKTTCESFLTTHSGQPFQKAVEAARTTTERAEEFIAARVAVDAALDVLKREALLSETPELQRLAAELGRQARAVKQRLLGSSPESAREDGAPTRKLLLSREEILAVTGVLYDDVKIIVSVPLGTTFHTEEHEEEPRPEDEEVGAPGPSTVYRVYVDAPQNVAKGDAIRVKIGNAAMLQDGDEEEDDEI